jgi:hypothetical protein
MHATVASLMAQIIPHFAIPANRYIIRLNVDSADKANADRRRSGNADRRRSGGGRQHSGGKKPDLTGFGKHA